jgi:hypothetical protein
MSSGHSERIVVKWRRILGWFNQAHDSYDLCVSLIRDKMSRKNDKIS